MAFLDFFLHLDKHVEDFFTNYQTLSYLIICTILFCETGLVVTPFLPGDSLLFAVGATIAKIGVLRLDYAIVLMLLAVFLGDNVNYFLGKNVGTRLFKTKNPLLQKLLKPEYLQRTEDFYQEHGGKTVIYARFIPIVRTFAPFVAGLGAMRYGKYIGYCLAGAALWVVGITLCGYFFGQMDFVKKHFELFVIGIVLVSVMPAVLQIFKKKK